MPNDVFPAARTIVPIAVAREPPPHVPGSFIFFQEYDTWYTENVLGPGLVDNRTIVHGLDSIWRAQQRIQKYLNEVP